MSATESKITLNGVSTRILEWKGAKAGGLPIILLHGGTPGVTPYCGGTHLWGALPEALAGKAAKVVAPDMIGSGGTDYVSPLSVDKMVAHIEALIVHYGGKAHLVGHDLGGAVAMKLAFAKPDKVASLSIVASFEAGVTGDDVENVTFRSPPQPMWTRASQKWAFDALSYSHFHIDEDLIAGSLANAELPAHKAAVEAARKGEDDLVLSVARTKYEAARDARVNGIKVPTQIIWGANDPLVSISQGFWLYRMLAVKQVRCHFHLINRAGSFPWREQPEEFLTMLEAFHQGLADEDKAAAA